MFTSPQAHIDSPITHPQLEGQNFEEHPHRCSLHSHEEKSTTNGRFGSGKWFFFCMFFLSFLRQVKPQQRCAPAEKSVINKIWLTAAPYFRLANHYDSSKWFAISSSPPICRSPFSFYGRGCKKSKQLSWDVSNIFAESHTEHQWGWMLSSYPFPHTLCLICFYLLLGVRARRSLRREYLDHGQSEPAPTNAPPWMDGAFDRTFFFIGFP
jgi:hypothetical protein